MPATVTASNANPVIQVSWGVTNQGIGAALGIWFDRVWFSTNGVLDANSIDAGDFYFNQGVPAGGNYSQTNSVTLPATIGGIYNYTLFVQVDIYNWLYESNKSNNISSPVSGTLILDLPPQIITQPVSRMAAPGASTTFSVTAAGTLPLHYQWQLNNANLAGATNTTLTLNNVQPADTGDYLVVVTNAFGSVVSATAGLVVVNPSATQTIQTKDNNTTQLTTGSSWVSQTAPGSGDIGRWDSIVTAANTVALGAAMPLGEIQIVNPGGNVNITDGTAANILTLNGAGGVGLDMSAATVNLTIGAPLMLGTNQTWNIASGQTVSLNGLNAWNMGASVLTIEGGGMLNVNWESDPTTAAASSSDAGLVISNSALGLALVSNTSEGTANPFFGANVTLTLTGNNTLTIMGTANTGDRTQAFSTLTMNPGSTVMTAGTRGASSGVSISFTAVSRNAGSMADVILGTGSTTFGGNTQQYAFPGSTVLGYLTAGGTDWLLAQGATTKNTAATYVNDTWASPNNTTVTGNDSPVSGSTVNSLRFGAAGAFTVTLTGANTITTGGILVNSTVGANAATITGGTLTSGNTNADGSHDLIIINNNTTAGGSVVINSVIADNGANSVGLTVGSTAATTPSGPVQLGAANTFSGTTYITRGMLMLNNSLALQNSTFNTTPSGTLSFGSLTAATFGGLSGTGSLSLPGGFALTLGNNNASSTFNGSLSGVSATVTKVGTGTLTLNGVNGCTGPTTVNAGTLAFGATGTVGGATIVNSPGVLDVSAAGTYSLARSVTGNGAINGNVSLVTGGVLSPAGTSGTLTLSNSLTLNGGGCLINMDAGAAQHGIITIGASGSGNLTLTSGTIQLNITDGTLANGTYKIIAVPYGTITGSGGSLAVSGFSQLNQAAAMVINSSVGGGYELDLVVSAYVAQNLLWLGDGAGVGLWNVVGDTDWNDLGPTVLNPSVFHNVDNVTFDDTSANTLVNLSGALSPLSVTINGSGSQQYQFQGSGYIGGESALQDNSLGALRILTVNSYSGGTTIGSGAGIQVGNGTTAGSIGSGPVLDNSTLTYNLPGGSTETMGAVSGSGTLSTTGAGSTLVLNGADTLAGATTITAGTLKQGAANVLPNGAGVGNMVVNGTLDLGGLSGTVNGLTGSGTIDSTVAGTLALTVTGSGSFSGVIKNTAGSLGVNMNGSGQTLNLGGVNTYSGGTTITAGTLQLGNDSGISSGSVAVFGTLNLNGFSPTFDALNGAGTIDSSGAGTMTMTIGNSGGNGTFSGAIKNTAGTVSLTKNGVGTEVLAGSNSYGGTTTINAGVLQLNAGGVINGGAVNVTSAAGAQLVINGGSLTASASSNLGGSSAGLLMTSGSATFNGGLTGDAGGTIDFFDITGGTLTASSMTWGRTLGASTQPATGDATDGLYINGGTVHVTGSLNMGTLAGANSGVNARMDSGSLAVDGVIYVDCNNTARWSILDVNGGTLTANETTTGIEVGGPQAGNAVFQVRGTGTANAAIITMGASGISDTNVLQLNAGTLYLGSGGIVQAGGTAIINLSGGILGATAGWSSSLPMFLGGTTIQAANASGAAQNISLSGVLSGTTLTKTGTGTLTLSGVNTFTGNIVNNAGILAIGDPGQLNSGNYSGTITNNATFSYNSTAAQTLGGIITGTGTLIQTGSGTLTLTSPNTYTGATTINGGRLALSGSGALASASTVNINAGGTFDVSALGVSATYTLGSGGLKANGAAVAAAIVPGATGIFDLNTQPVSLTWSGASSGTDSTHPSLTVSQGTLNFNNNIITLIVPGTALKTGVYTLISAAAITGTPSAILSYTGGNGVAAGYSGAISVSGSSVILTVTQLITVADWTDGGGDQKWSNVANWSGGVPQFAGDSAIFGSAAGSAVTLNVSETVGQMIFTNPNSYTISGANTLTLDNSGNGAALNVTAGTANAIQTPISLNDNATATVGTSNQLTLSGVVANASNGAKNLAISGGGTTILSNVNTYGPPSAGTLGTTLSGGILQVGNDNSLGAGDVSVVGSGTLQSGATVLNLANNITVQPDITVTADNNGNMFALGGVIGGVTGNLVTTGLGTNLLSAVETYGGTTTINSGSTLTIGGSGQLGGGAYAQTIADNGALNYNSSATQTVSGVISGSGVMEIGAGILTLPATNTYSGGTVINGGVVQLGNAASLGAGTITNNGGTMSVPAGTTISNSLFFTGTSVINLNGGGGGNNSWPGSWSGNGAIIISNMDVVGTTLTMGGGSSTATMNAFSGKIIVAPMNSGGLASRGTLRFNSGTSAYNTGNASASFNLGTNVNDAVFLTSREGGTINLGELIGGPSTVLLGSRSTTGTTIWSVGGLNTSTAFAGSISNYSTTEIAALTKIGTGTLILTGTNTDIGNAATGPTGPIVVSGGTLQIGDGGADGTLTSGGVTITSPGILAFDRSDTYTVTNVITGTGAVNMMGNGTLILSSVGGANTYNGNTTVSAGTLLVNSSISSAVNVSGGILGGSGSIGGSVAVQSGGALAPGEDVSAAGTVLTMNSSLTLASGSACIMAVSHNNHTNDQIVCSGVSYGGTLTVITNAGDGPLVAGDTFQLFKASLNLYTGGFNATNLPALSPGLAWSNSVAANGSIEVVVSAAAPAPVAGFSGTPTNLFVTQTVTFTDASTGSITNWVWNFGDGHSVTNSSNASVTHAYAAAGTCTVSLTVTGAGGSNTSTRSSYMMVKPKSVLGGVAVTSNGKLVMSGTNGPAGAQYRILTTTNVALPVANWTPVWTNVFGTSGGYGYTNTPGVNPAGFFLLVSP
jgi:autotransporter-associated beta strand protein